MGFLIEFCDGCLEFPFVVGFVHQRILLFLYKLLDDYVDQYVLGEVLVAPCWVRTIPGKIREPDVFYVRPERVPDPRRPAWGPIWPLKL